MRLVHKGWATIGEMKSTVTRKDVIDANDWMDAIEEAEEVARKKAQKK